MTTKFGGAEISPGVVVTQAVQGGHEYVCPQCSMKGEPRPEQVEAMEDLLEHWEDGQCIGPVMQNLGGRE